MALGKRRKEDLSFFEALGLAISIETDRSRRVFETLKRVSAPRHMGNGWESHASSAPVLGIRFPEQDK